MTVVQIPADLWPATALDLYRVVMSVPDGLRVRITAILPDRVEWVTLP